MLAVCYERSPKTLTIRGGLNRFHKMADGTEQMEIIPEVLVKFDLVQQRDTEDVFEDPSFMPGGPTPRRGCARVAGKVGIEQAAAEARIEPEELVFWMLHDPAYDTPQGFVVVRDDGKKVLDLHDWVYDKEKEFCRACNRVVAAKGVATHFSKSKEHQEALDRWRRELKQRVIQLGREIKPEDTVAHL